MLLWCYPCCILKLELMHHLAVLVVFSLDLQRMLEHIAIMYKI